MRNNMPMKNEPIYRTLTIWNLSIFLANSHIDKKFDFQFKDIQKQSKQNIFYYEVKKKKRLLSYILIKIIQYYNPRYV